MVYFISVCLQQQGFYSIIVKLKVRSGQIKFSYFIDIIDISSMTIISSNQTLMTYLVTRGPFVLSST